MSCLGNLVHGLKRNKMCKHGEKVLKISKTNIQHFMTLTLVPLEGFTNSHSTAFGLKTSLNSEKAKLWNQKVGEIFGLRLIDSSQNVTFTIDAVIVWECKILSGCLGPSFAFGSFPFQIILDLYIWKKNHMIMIFIISHGASINVWYGRIM